MEIFTSPPSVELFYWIRLILAIVQLSRLTNDEDFEIESESKIAPIDRIVIPKDVVSFSEEDESIHVVGTRGGKVTKIAGLENMNKLKVIINYFFGVELL